MAVDLSARICTNCTHASLCPYTDEFLAFYENRDKVMVKCGDDSGDVDTSSTYNIRIEHRYLDGPALEELAKAMGLHVGGWYPCAAPYNNCPFMRHPFDTPILSPYPNPAGYIAPLCSGARDAMGNRLPYIAPTGATPTNIYASAATSAYMSCVSCGNYNDCVSNFDYSILGGSVYSTFGVTYMDADEGDTILLDDIEYPDQLASGYVRADSNPLSFTVESETDVFIIYYTYQGTSTTTPSYNTLDELEEEGLIHTMKFFYSGRSFVYPSSSAEPSPVAMLVEMKSVTTGPNGRADSSGNTIAGANYTVIPFRSMGSGSLSLNYNEIGTDDVDAVDVTSYNYQQCEEMVEGDKVQIRYVFDKKWKLETTLMKTMSPGINLMDFSSSETFRTDGKVETILTFTVPNGDFVVQTILVDRKKFLDAATYVNIDYITYWKNLEVEWATREVAVTLLGEVVMVSQPIPPRYWSKNLVTDSMPFYATDYPPDETCIVRPNFTLIGYTDNAEYRYTFNEILAMFDAEAMEYILLATNTNEQIVDNEVSILAVHIDEGGSVVATRTKTPSSDIFFLKKSEDDPTLIVRGISFLETVLDEGYVGGFAMWKLDSATIETQVIGGLQAIDGSVSKIEDTTDLVSLTPSDMIYDWESRGLSDPYMDEVYMTTHLNWPMSYMPHMDLRLLVALNTVKWPDNFIFHLYRLPTNMKESIIWNRMPANETIVEGREPTCTIELGDGTTVELSSLKVTTDNTFDDTLEAEYLLIVQPSEFYGLSPYYQNYKMYQIHVTQTPVELTPLYTFEGKYMNIYGMLPSLSNISSYTLQGLYADDSAYVSLDIVDNENGSYSVSLVGDRAKFYTLSENADVRYCQTVTTHSTYKNACSVEDQVYQVPYRGAYNFEFTPPTGHSVISVMVDSTYIYAIEDDERVFNQIDREDGTQIYALLDTDTNVLTVHVANVGSDVDITTIFTDGDDGSIVGCSRCRGYVDTSTRDYLEWVPVCLNFEQS